MKSILIGFVSSILFLAPLTAQKSFVLPFKKGQALDSISLSDPCILADKKTNMYYMTGTGGFLWKSKDLKYWDGPYQVT